MKQNRKKINKQKKRNKKRIRILNLRTVSDSESYSTFDNVVYFCSIFHANGIVKDRNIESSFRSTRNVL